MTQVKLMTEENGLEVLQERINKFIKDDQQSFQLLFQVSNQLSSSI